MTPHDLVNQLEELELSIVDLMPLLGVDDQRCSRWLNGKEPIPVWLKLMLSYWSEMPKTLAIAQAFADQGRRVAN